MERKKIMIVDDAPLMRLVIHNLLRGDPHLCLVAFASNGQEALDKLPEAEPDLILLDLDMPVMDGLEFLRHARLKTRARVVVLTSIAPRGSPRALQAQALGADAVISKPSGAVSYDLADKAGNEIKQTIYQLLGITGELQERAAGTMPQ
ncbi:MAG: response regulator [Anaerolineae bacterium]|nr:response regulator [Anaerolineae bacterium]